MNPYPAILRFTVLLANVVVLGGGASCPRAGAQPAPASRLDPATGMPLPSGRSPAIDPATGLPVPAVPPGSAPPDTSALASLDRARELTGRGRFEEALRCYLSYYNQTRASGTNGPLVLALADWVELGQRYPKAKEALLNIRDSDTREFVEGRGDVTLFRELAEINAALGEKDSTFALYLGLEQSDAPLARRCYMVLEPALVERGEYGLCARYLDNPQGRFEIARRSFEMGQGLAQQYAAGSERAARRLEAVSQTNGSPRPNTPRSDPSSTIRKAASDSFVSTVGQLLEILVAAGRQEEAEKLRAQALTALDDPRLQPCISDVEAKVRSVQAASRPRPAPTRMHPRFVESSTLFVPVLPEPSASVERWVPPPAARTKRAMQLILAEAKDLTAEGHYEESLQRHLWYHNHALDYDPEGQRGVRLSYALRDWTELGRHYPKAREALVEIRGRDLHEFAQGRGSVGLFEDIVAINEYWGCEATTCRLFKYLNEKQPELAKRCYPIAEAALVKQAEYALCVAYVGDGQARFERHRQNWEKQAQWERRMAQIPRKMDEYWAQKGRERPPGLPRYELPRAADNLLVGGTRQLIEILVGAGHKADAENIRTQALALLDDPRLRSAVSDAAKRTGK